MDGVVMDDEETTKLRDRLKRALELLREWRDKHGSTEHYKMRGVYGITGASPTDLLRETVRILENR